MRAFVRTFLGMRPSRAPDLLPAGEAQYAKDVKITGGDLKPLPGLLATALTLTSASTIKTIYRFGQLSLSDVIYWFQFTGDVDVVKGPIDGDTTERTFFTDGVYPKKTNAALATASPPYPSASYAMGVPAPTSAPTLVVSGTPTNASDPIEVVVYCLTYVSTWGEEGAPGPASASASWQPGQTITVNGMAVSPGTGAHGENYVITGKRLYRSAKGSSNSAFLLVNPTDIPIATTTYVDTTITANLLSAIVTTGWSEPPYNMIGLCALANGFMAGFTGNTLCFSEPGCPYAWPVRYQQSTDAPIVGIAPCDQGVFVGTTQGIYIFTGTDPSAMTSTKMLVAQSVVSKRSVVAMMGGVMFASPDGLFKYDGNGITCATDGLMTRVEWQAYVPSSIYAYESDNRYIAFFDTGVRQEGLVFCFGAFPSFSETSLYAIGGYRDRQRDTLYLVATGANPVLSKWDSGTALTYTYTSAILPIAMDTNMAVARIDASAYPINFTLYADGAIKFGPTAIANRFAFKLPGGYTSIRYHFTLTGTGIVRSVEMADSMDELAVPMPNVMAVSGFV